MPSLCAALLDRGAAKVYAGVRDVSSVHSDGIEAVRLDITSETDVAAAVKACGDVTLLINNAGIGTGTSVLAGDAMDKMQREFDTNVLGPLAMSRAFAPVLADNGGGAIVNVLSVLSWFAAPPSALYCAAEGGVVVADELAAARVARPTNASGGRSTSASWTPT